MTGITERIFATRFHASTADMSRDEKIAWIADQFIGTYAERISPIVHFENELFGSHPVVGQDKILVLEGAVQAATELWSDGEFVGGLPKARNAHRLANQAIDQALRLMRSDVPTDNISLAHVIGKALPLI